MRFLVWCGCVTVALSGLQLSLFARNGWLWVWIVILSFYLLAGMVLAGMGIVRALAGKVDLGGLGKKGVAKINQAAESAKKE